MSQKCEALGVIGIVAPEEAGLLGLISTIMPAIAMGNRVVVVPSQQYALLATDFYQVLDTSDLPGGAVNIVTGDQQELTLELAKHYDIEGLWYWGTAEGSQLVETEAAATMKRSCFRSISAGRSISILPAIWLRKPMSI